MKSITYRIFELTKLQREKYKKQMLNFLLRQDFNYFITLNFFVPQRTNEPEWLKSWDKPGKKSAFQPALNDLPLNFASGRNAIKKWQAFIDSHFLGRTWSKADTDQRLFFFAFPELGSKSSRTDNNLHYHLIARVPYDPSKFEDQAVKAWQKIIPSGQADCQRIGDTNDDHYRTRNYATKHLSADDGVSNFIISTEFQA